MKALLGCCICLLYSSIANVYLNFSWYGMICFCLPIFIPQHETYLKHINNIYPYQCVLIIRQHNTNVETYNQSFSNNETHILNTFSYTKTDQVPMLQRFLVYWIVCKPLPARTHYKCLCIFIYQLTYNCVILSIEAVDAAVDDQNSALYTTTCQLVEEILNDRSHVVLLNLLAPPLLQI